MFSFRNKIVLVTGGASGIGKQLGYKSLKKGAVKLIIWDIDQGALDATKSELENEGYEVYIRNVDVSDPHAVRNAASQEINAHGGIDILFNNAGIVKGKNFNEQGLDEITQTIGVNSLGLMYVARSFLPEMISKGSAYIINIASAAGLTPNPGMAVYAASKWAAVGWSESLKLELEKANTSVKVLTVMPSYINTGMFKGVKPPKLIPFLDPDKITDKIIRSVEKEKARLREPFMVKFTPLIKGILPAPVYDLIADKFLGVYRSMDSFIGREGDRS